VETGLRGWGWEQPHSYEYVRQFKAVARCGALRYRQKYRQFEPFASPGHQRTLTDVGSGEEASPSEPRTAPATRARREPQGGARTSDRSWELLPPRCTRRAIHCSHSAVAILSSGLTPSNPTIRTAVRSSSCSTLGMCTTASGVCPPGAGARLGRSPRTGAATYRGAAGAAHGHACRWLVIWHAILTPA
jgi:hypothetical protein